MDFTIDRDRYDRYTSGGFGGENRAKLDFSVDSRSYEPPAGTPYPNIGPSMHEQGVMSMVRNKQITPLTAGVLGLFDPQAYTHFVIDMVPRAKWMVTADRRQQYRDLPEEEKRQADLHEAISAAWWIGAAGLPKVAQVLYRQGKKAITGLRGAALRTKVMKATPFEDTATWAGKHYDYEVRSALADAKFGKEATRLRENEVDAIARYMQGNEYGLSAPFLRTATKPGEETTSKAYRAITRRENTVTPRWNLDQKVLMDYSTEGIRRKTLLTDFSYQLPKVRKGAKLSSEVGLRVQAERFYGKEIAAKMDMNALTAEQLHNFSSDLLMSNYAQLAVRAAHQIYPWAWGAPVRKVLGGRRDALWGTYDKIYMPIKEGTVRTNKWVGEQIAVYNEIATQRGLMTFDAKKQRFNWDGVVKKDLDHAGLIINKRDNLLREAHLEKDPARFKAKLNQAHNEIARMKPSGGTQAILDSVYAFEDHLYIQEAVSRVEQSLISKGLSSYGANHLNKILFDTAKGLQGILGTTPSKDYITRVNQLSNLLDETYHSVRKAPAMFNAVDDELAKIYKSLRQELTLPTRNYGPLQVGTNTQGGFIPYLETTFVNTYNADTAILRKFAGPEMERSTNIYNHLKRDMDVDLADLKPKNLARIIVGRTQAQGKRMFLHPELKTVIENSRGLPNDITEYVQHLSARSLGLPSKTDYAIGKMIETTKLPGVWDAYRTMRAAKTINDFTYMGFLGFKPFSAARNYFQPFLMVPADLGGGFLDYFYLSKGWVFAATKKGKKLLDEIGVLGEYLPEQEIGHRLPNISRTIGGVKIPRGLSSLDPVRDASLWMFKSSDQFNRHVSGGAALFKWQDGVSKVMGETQNIPSPSQVKQIMRKTGARLRTQPIQGKIEQEIARGNYTEARNLFVKDVVADTQYLYGGVDSPIYSQKWGGVGKTMSVFQSWWLNYGNAMHNWMTTGTTTDKIKRMATWMISGAVAYKAMEQLWGEGTAGRTVLLGPMPTPSQGLRNFVPPIWRPAADALRMAEATYAMDRERFNRAGIRLIKDTIAFAPGGLQAIQSWKAYSEDGIAAVPGSLLKLKRD